MAYKDGGARKVMKKMFDIPMYICIFHVLKILSRIVTFENVKITQEEKEYCLTQLKLVYSSSEEKYLDLYNEFRENAPSGVIDYFDKNWHHCRQEWCVFYMIKGNFNNKTNNRLESVN